VKKVIYTKQNQALCEWLRACRQKEGVTARALAKRLKIHHSVVYRVENGERMLNFVEFIEWVVAL
jgi:Helix-turn-helix.